jgi:hypothetical protein
MKITMVNLLDASLVIPSVKIFIYAFMHCSFDILHLLRQHMCGNRSWHIYSMHLVLPLKSGVTMDKGQTS